MHLVAAGAPSIGLIRSGIKMGMKRKKEKEREGEGEKLRKENENENDEKKWEEKRSFESKIGDWKFKES